MFRTYQKVAADFYRPFISLHIAGVNRRMQLAGSMMISFNPLLDHSLPRFFRLILNNTTVCSV